MAMNFETVDKVRVDGRQVGKIKEDEKGRKWFVTHREPDHYVRAYNGYGITKEVVDSYSFIDFIAIQYQGKEDTKDWRVPMDKFLEHSEVDSLGGFEEQHFISEKDLDKIDIR